MPLCSTRRRTLPNAPSAYGTDDARILLSTPQAFISVAAEHVYCASSFDPAVAKTLLLLKNRAGVRWKRALTLGDNASSASGSSVDDRVSFRRDGSASSSVWPASSPKSDRAPNAVAVSSDWLLAGETARTGMIESVSAENSGRSGTKLVDDGVFQTRLLCPSQVRLFRFCSQPCRGERD